TSELKVNGSVIASPVPSPLSPPAASERLLESLSWRALVAPVGLSVGEGGGAGLAVLARFGAPASPAAEARPRWRGPAGTLARAAPVTAASRWVVLLALESTKPNRPVARANDVACVSTPSKRVRKSTPS